MSTVAPMDATGGVTVTSPAPRDAWTELLARDSEALVSQSPTWIEFMRAFGYDDVSRLYSMPGGERLLLPLVRRRHLMPTSLTYHDSMPPAWGMGGVLSDSSLDADGANAIVSDLRAQPAVVTRIRPNPMHGAAWSAAVRRGVTMVPRLAHVLDLNGGSGAVWRRLSKNGRSGVRKAQRSGLVIECDSSGQLVPVFFELLGLSVARWAQHQHEPLPLARWRARRRDPIRKFECMAAALGDRMRVWVAWKDGVAAASVIVLLGANASDTRGAMNKEVAARTNANDLLQWLAIEDACRAGCRRYHLGESGPSRSLARFKEKFGARPVAYPELRIERLPVARVDALARRTAKAALGFRDA